MRGACDEQTCDEWFPTKQECSQKCKPAAALTGTCYGNGTTLGIIDNNGLVLYCGA